MISFFLSISSSNLLLFFATLTAQMALAYAAIVWAVFNLLFLIFDLYNELKPPSSRKKN